MIVETLSTILDLNIYPLTGDVKREMQYFFVGGDRLTVREKYDKHIVDNVFAEVSEGDVYFDSVRESRGRVL